MSSPADVYEKEDLPEIRPTRRVIIAGSRSYRGGEKGVARAVAASGYDVQVVLCGNANGADHAGKWWAESNGIPVEFFPARWNTMGRGAGLRRNKEMAKHADALIALWDGLTPGTAHMIEQMRDKPTTIYWESQWTRD